MEMPALPLGSRRNEDIALDLMKFIAMTTGYGKTSGAGVGFQGSGAADKPEDYAAHLLELGDSDVVALAVAAGGDGEPGDDSEDKHRGDDELGRGLFRVLHGFILSRRRGCGVRRRTFASRTPMSQK